MDWSTEGRKCVRSTSFDHESTPIGGRNGVGQPIWAVEATPRSRSEPSLRMTTPFLSGVRWMREASGSQKVFAGLSSASGKHCARGALNFGT